MTALDAFPHILPRPLFERMAAVAQSPAARSWVEGSRRQTGLYDLDLRLRVLDAVGDYQQVLTLAAPPLEQVATGATGRDLARLANDSVAVPAAVPPQITSPGTKVKSRDRYSTTSANDHTMSRVLKCWRT